MKVKSIAAFLLLALSAVAVAEVTTEADYVNRLNYQRNKLEIVSKKRLIDEKRSYSTTNIDLTTYSHEAYTQHYGSTSTSSLSQAEMKEVPDWYIYKGGIRELSDLEFLALVGDNDEYKKVKEAEDYKAGWRALGGLAIGSGIATMVGGAALSASQAVITGGALLTTCGFFLSAFNIPPHHYLLPDYAQEKVDEYNVNLKKNLGLPIDLM